MEVLLMVALSACFLNVGGLTGSLELRPVRVKRSSSPPVEVVQESDHWSVVGNASDLQEVKDALRELHSRLDRIEQALTSLNGVNSERCIDPPLDIPSPVTDVRLLQKLGDLERRHEEFQAEYRQDVRRLLVNRDCEDFHRKGSTQSGVYVVYPVEGSNPVRVDCDMETDGGGWTVIQRRGPRAALDFHRDWVAYRDGFGDPRGEFWLGNEAVHQLTTTAPKGYSLLVELRHSNDDRRWTAKYRRFALDSEDKGYVLNLATYVGNATDGLYSHHGRPFRTWDREEDQPGRACAWLERSGWWYHPVKVTRPHLHHICSYPLAGTNLNAPGATGAPEVHSQVMTLQPPPGQSINQTITLSFVYLGTLYWMDKDGRHFDRVEMKIRPNY